MKQDKVKVKSLEQDGPAISPQLSESNTQMLKRSGGTAIPNGLAFQARGGRTVYDTVKDRTVSDPAEWLLAVNNPLCWESQLNVSSAGRRSGDFQALSCVPSVRMAWKRHHSSFPT